MADTHPTTPVVILDEFLAAEEWRSLLTYIAERAQEFVATQVIHNDGESRLDRHYRRSRVLFELGPFYEVFVARLVTFLPHVLARLGHPAFPISQIEAQLTATSNGDYFRPHTDNDAGQVMGRTVTFVYFFHREPRRFSGGELRVYNTNRRDGAAAGTNSHRIVYPLQNQVVFFPSGALHEIMPVGCPSGEFLDSRFTVNGWFHR